MLILLVVLAGLFSAADFAARYLANDIAAQEATALLDLQSKPTVNITGFPFLLQAARGHFNRIEVDADRLQPQDRLTLNDVNAELRDVTVPVKQILQGGRKSASLGGLSAHATLTYAQLTSLMNTPAVPGVKNVKLGYASGNSVLQASVLGKPIAIPIKLDVSDGRFMLRVPEESLTGLNPTLRAFILELDQVHQIPQLPYKLTIKNVETTPDGLVVDATAGAITLR